jgi:hypothetical protein
VQTPHAQPPVKEGFWRVPQMRYQDAYVWFLFLAAGDVMLTWFILERRGGSEVNPIADLVIKAWGLWGAIGFKFSLVLFVIVVCETIGRRSAKRADFLIGTAIVVSAMPVLYSLGLLAWHAMSMQ